MDRVARRLADKANALRGILTLTMHYAYRNIFLMTEHDRPVLNEIEITGGGCAPVAVSSCMVGAGYEAFQVYEWSFRNGDWSKVHRMLREVYLAMAAEAARETQETVLSEGLAQRPHAPAE